MDTAHTARAPSAPGSCRSRDMVSDILHTQAFLERIVCGAFCICNRVRGGPAGSVLAVSLSEMRHVTDLLEAGVELASVQCCSNGQWSTSSFSHRPLREVKQEGLKTQVVVESLFFFAEDLTGIQDKGALMEGEKPKSEVLS
ncbi:hypothetical protein RRG08_008700 [Elysia crispata]|uniref:Uncharacterized protein n=1 Tax=Elysia crispata TaxID=231223 RepID=A0AAE0XPQ8_9GAST|nr:hypothetical protein RRG08_008700 [Elysia crispata]